MSDPSEYLYTVPDERTDITDSRPNPEEFLVLADEEERKKKKGALTIYLGYAAGVGKTYAMLSDAILRRLEGHDIVAGYIETHGRHETEVLAGRLEQVTPLHIHYRELDLYEPDIDRILIRRPEIVLVDELAHSDAPGLRNMKRFQDIEELLNAGISVWTTVNIQHIESLNDAVLQITGVNVRETVPDTILRNADYIKLIDLPPDELQERLREGKVYVQDMALEAISRFFEAGNLMALRELALRTMAGVTDQRMLRHKHLTAAASPWPATERILVGIRPGPFAERMVRAAYRMSVRLNAEWEVLYVETEADAHLSDREQTWLEEAMSTAHKLGGHIVRCPGTSVADEMIRYAQGNNITMILLGKPRGLDILVSPVYRVLHQAKGIDIHLYDWKSDFHPPLHRQIPRLLPRHYLIGIIGVIAVTLLNYLLLGTISNADMIILQLLPVVLVAYFFERGSAIFTAIFSILLFDFAFVPPYFSLTLHETGFFISFVGYVIIALIISYLATKLRYILQKIWRSEVKVSAISSLSQELADAGSRAKVLDILIRHGKAAGAEKVTIYLPDSEGLTAMEGDRDYGNQTKEDTIAKWSFENGRPAGRGTQTLPDASGTYIPLRAHEKTIGVIGYHFGGGVKDIPADTLEILETMGKIGALALEQEIVTE